MNDTASAAPVRDYPPLPDFETVEQHIYGACRRYITQDTLEPIHNLIRDAIDADRAMRAQAAPAQERQRFYVGVRTMKCKCTLAQKIVGDGCDECNPKLALEHAQAVIDEMAERLLLIGNMAHDASTGPAIPDVLWEIRNLAYEHI